VVARGGQQLCSSLGSIASNEKLTCFSTFGLSSVQHTTARRSFPMSRLVLCAVAIVLACAPLAPAAEVPLTPDVASLVSSASAQLLHADHPLVEQIASPFTSRQAIATSSQTPYYREYELVGLQANQIYEVRVSYIGTVSTRASPSCREPVLCSSCALS
jgi:hypothetical protein